MIDMYIEEAIFYSAYAVALLAWLVGFLTIALALVEILFRKLKLSKAIIQGYRRHLIDKENKQ